MIHEFSIRNFKSVRDLHLGCRRVNVFIGEPNAGKTNILEALALRCPEIYGPQFNRALRIGKIADLFRDQNTGSHVIVDFGPGVATTLVGAKSPASIDLTGPHGSSKFGILLDKIVEFDPATVKSPTSYYLFSRLNEAQGVFNSLGNRLQPPFGFNFGALLSSSKEARVSASGFFEGSGFKLNVDQSSFDVFLSKEREGVLLSLQYDAASETLRRMVFFHLVLNTNRNQILVLDEPEAHAYPPYTKILAETIAQDDKGNQFFLTTHSPYLLTSLISKTPVKDLNVILCRMENFETKGYVMTEEQKLQLMEWDMSAFFNFDRLLPEME